MNNPAPFFITNHISLHPDELYIYGKLDWIDGMHKVSSRSMANLETNYTHNKLSDKSKKKAKRAIKYLLYNSAEKKAYNRKLGTTFTFKVNFITLTLSSSQIHSDQQIKASLLNQFLIEAKKKWNLKNYVWKSEIQANGNIHFHILSDVWIPWLELRNTWNRIQNKLGYVDRFTAINHKNNPNSTDVHSLRKVKNVTAYMIKYMTKDNKLNKTTISSKIVPKLKGLGKDNISLSKGAKKYLAGLSNCGRIWTCSKELSNLTGARTELSEAIEEEVKRIQNAKGSRRFDKDFVTGIYFSNDILMTGDYPVLRMLLTDYVRKVFKLEQQLILNLT
jgi:hypothetical protein